VFSSERTCTLLAPPREAYIDNPTRLQVSGGLPLPSYLKTFLDVKQLRNCYLLAACMQLSLQGEEKLVCSLAPLLFSSQSINLIKDVASPYKLCSFSREQKEARAFAY